MKGVAVCSARRREGGQWARNPPLPKGGHREGRARRSPEVCSEETRGRGHKLQQGKFL